MSGVAIRVPEIGEWPVCRMLLPETAEHAVRYDYRLAIDPVDGKPAGAAAFVDNGVQLCSLQIHTVVNRRTQGVGGQLLDWVLTEARQRKREAVSANLSGARDQLAHAFLIARAFEVRSQFSTAEGDLRDVYERQIVRCRRAADLDGGEARVVPLSAGMLRDAGKLVAEHITELEPLPGANYFLPATAAGLGLSQALIVKETLAGMVLISRREQTIIFDVRVVSPSLRNTRTSAFLLMQALRVSLETGAARLRFSYTSRAVDTAAFVRRMGMQVIDTVDHLVRKVGPVDEG